MRLLLRDAHVGLAEEKVQQNIFRFFFLFFLPVIFLKLLFSCGMQVAGTSVHDDEIKFHCMAVTILRIQYFG